MLCDTYACSHSYKGAAPIEVVEKESPQPLNPSPDLLELSSRGNAPGKVDGLSFGPFSEEETRVTGSWRDRALKETNPQTLETFLQERHLVHPLLKKALPQFGFSGLGFGVRSV